MSGAPGEIAEAVGAAKSIQSQKVTGGVSDKSWWEGRGQPCWDPRWGRRNPFPSPEPSQRGI